MKYTDWQQIVIEELEELQEKIIKLKIYITENHKKINEDDLCDLQLQYAAMQAYIDILELRIFKFK